MVAQNLRGKGVAALGKTAAQELSVPLSAELLGKFQGQWPGIMVQEPAADASNVLEVPARPCFKILPDDPPEPPLQAGRPQGEGACRSSLAHGCINPNAPGRDDPLPGDAERHNNPEASEAGEVLSVRAGSVRSVGSTGATTAVVGAEGLG